MNICSDKTSTWEPVLKHRDRYPPGTDKTGCGKPLAEARQNTPQKNRKIPLSNCTWLKPGEREVTHKTGRKYSQTIPNKPMVLTASYATETKTMTGIYPASAICTDKEPTYAAIQTPVLIPFKRNNTKDVAPSQTTKRHIRRNFETENTKTKDMAK